MADDGNLERLARLAGIEPTDMTDEELNEAARLVGSLSRETPQRAGRLIAELRRRSVSWSRIVEITGIPQTTAFAWAERHGRLRPHEADEH